MADFLSRAEEFWKDSRILAWGLVLLAMGTALWSATCPQSPGVSIGLLACAAGIMSLRPDMHFYEKAAWVVVIVFFTVLEVRAINRSDQENFVNLMHQNSQFKETQDNISRSIDISREDFEATMMAYSAANQRAQTHFESTISTLLATHKQDETEFAGVLTKQDQAFEAERELSEEFIGRLVPGNLPSPINACSQVNQEPGEGEVLIIHGDDADIVTKFPSNILTYGNSAIVSVDRVEHSQDLALSVDIRDSQNKISFRMDKNGVVNREQGIILLHPDKSTFLLQDLYGREVFRAQFLNPKTFEISGQMGFCGQTVYVQDPHFHNNCLHGIVGYQLLGFLALCGSRKFPVLQHRGFMRPMSPSRIERFKT